MPEIEIEIVREMHNVLGEAPMWHIGERALYWIDALKPANPPARWRGRDRDLAPPLSHRLLRVRRTGGLIGALRDGFHAIRPREGYRPSPSCIPSPNAWGTSSMTANATGAAAIGAARTMRPSPIRRARSTGSIQISLAIVRLDARDRRLARPSIATAITGVHWFMGAPLGISIRRGGSSAKIELPVKQPTMCTFGRSGSRHTQCDELDRSRGGAREPEARRRALRDP